VALRTLESLGDPSGKRVIVRCDLNVPLDHGTITDDGRIRASLGTLRELTDAGARVVVISHLGRPDGQERPEFSLAPVATRLGELLDAPVVFARDTVGHDAERAVATLGDGQVAVLENLRFHGHETSKDPAHRRDFAEKLARLGDAVVEDGFGAAHRKHASVYELPALLPSAAGRLVEAELRVLERLTSGDPSRPYTVVLGGSKVSDKLGVIEALLPRIDRLLIGGGMLFTFLAAQGHAIGKSLLDADGLDAARGYLARAEELGVDLVLPTDVVVADRFAADAAHEVAAIDAIEKTAAGAEGLGLDIGPDTAARFAELIRGSATVFWNGPMGVFELEPFAAGTKAVAQALTEVHAHGAGSLSVVGGGDSAAAVRQLGFADEAFGHISTGGGASLEFLEGTPLPGLEALGWEPTA
jgi:phosphoglycerate kinase